MWDIEHQSIQWTSGPYQDVVHYSRIGYPSFLKCLVFSDFLSHLTGPDMQNFSLFGKSQNRRSIDQEHFKSTLPMPVDHHVTTLGSSMDGFQQFWQFLIFRQTWQVWTCNFELWKGMWDIQHQSTQWKSGPYEDAIYYSWIGYWWYLKCLSFFDILSNLTSLACKIFHFLENHRTGDLSIKNALSQPYQCHSLLIITSSL